MKNSDTVFIVGGGPSITSINLKTLADEDTIGVNKSALFVPNVNNFVTMDYTVIRKLGDSRIKNLNCSRYFVANMSINYMRNIGGVITDVRSGFKYDKLYDIFDSVIVCRREDGMGTAMNDFRCGNNSGYSALQLAVVLGYKTIYLLGMDFNVEGTKTHFHSGYREDPRVFTKRMTGYAQYFIRGVKELEQKLPDVKVYSGSKKSALNNVIPYMDVNEVLKR